jgi:hypothetical protein
VCAPGVAPGTTNDNDANDPLVSVDEAGDTVSGTPSQVAVTAADAGNPDPETVPVDATAPLDGDNPTDRVTVKLEADVAEFAPSETATAYADAGRAGTVKVRFTVPLPLLVAPDVIDAPTPPTVTVSIAFGVKFDPVIVTDEATLPDVGLGVPTAAVGTSTTIGSLSDDTAENVWKVEFTRYT